MTVKPFDWQIYSPPPPHSKDQEFFYLGSMYSEDTFKSFLSMLHSTVFDYKTSGSRYALNNTAVIWKTCVGVF